MHSEIPSPNRLGRPSVLAMLAAFVVVAFSSVGCGEKPRDPMKGPIVLADPGWTDLQATNACAKLVLWGLGHEVELLPGSVPETFAALTNARADVFLGNWLPSQKDFVDSRRAELKVEDVGINLDGARFSLATSAACAAEGLKTFADIAAFKEKLEGRIHGLEPGNDGNRLIERAIADGRFGDGFELVSQEDDRALFAAVDAAIAEGRCIVFLAWTPHPVTLRHELAWLEGGDDVFGPDFGGAEVRTLTRERFSEDRPELGALFRNMKFTVEMETEIMAAILDGKKPDDAAREWLKAHPDVVAEWLRGVEAADGSDGLAAVRRSLGID